MKKLLLSLCMILALAACKDENKAKEANTKPVVKIGIMYPMSGDGAAFGDAAKNDVEMFFEEFNKKPHKFEYQAVFEDTQYKLAKQATLAQKLINVDKADVLITVMSNFGAVVSPMAEQSKVIHFSVATDPAVAKGKYNLITSSNPEGEADTMYRQLLKQGVKKVDVIVVNATGPQSMVDYFQKRIEQDHQIEIGQIFHVNAEEKDFRLMLYKIKESNPDYILVQLAMPTIDVFMKQYRESQINIPVTGIESYTYLQNRELAEGLWYVDAAPATDEFVKKYQEKTGKTATDYAEYMDFILQMITFGYEGAGTTDKEKVIDYIQNNSAGQNTAVGIISTDEDGILQGQAIVKKIINGQPVVVKE
ncbi:MAG: ABC transporter substrate-binding protein [Alphaproteobacteria bacterium]|nr:ABC transporter substrate-binding protein [Alphaproteobacteria bacterium]